MKNRFYIKYFIIFSIILIGLLPIYNFYDFAKKYDFKQSFNLDNIEKYVNYTVYKLFNRSLNQEQVITGKDNFLFLGNNYAKVLHKTNGTFKYTQEEVDIWTNKLKDLQNWYEDRGIKFIIAIAPNKHSIYKDKLPNWMKYDEKTITDDIAEQANLKNINMLDLRNILIDSKEKEESILYWRTDTHWNQKGASIAFDSVIKQLNKIYQLNLISPKYTLQSSTRGGGDLANFLKINSILKNNYEVNYIYSFDKNYNICKGNIKKENSILEKCENIPNPIVGINSQAQYTINNNSENKQKLLFLCDSFGTAPSQLYNSTFSYIYKFHWGHINGQKLANFIEENNPDIVIYQIVERHLYENFILESLPQIYKLNRNINLDSLIFDISKDKYYKNNHFEITSKDSELSLNVTNNDPIIILNQTKSNSKNVVLSYEIESEIDTIFQIFYKKENNSIYNEADSYKVKIKKGTNNINLLIPAKYINNEIRLDLVSSKGLFNINNLKLYSYK